MSGPERGRRHRRVLAPATNPAADDSDDGALDDSDDEAIDDSGDGTDDEGAAGGPDVSEQDARDAWIREQRPPHWG